MILSIKYEITCINQIDFGKTIDAFASARTRKRR